tara:strand:+ start:584 stop:4981 length:4398 start_codon:yes stop_codon:yes gene_type:complete
MDLKKGFKKGVELKKSQAALEYALTHIWAVFLVIIIIGLLGAFLFFNTNVSVINISNLINRDEASLTGQVINSEDEISVVESNCVLTRAYWQQEDAIGGNNVNLIVEGENCEKKNAKFTIYETDGIFGEQEIETLEAVFQGNSAIVTWQALYEKDWFFNLIYSNPEYKFKVQVNPSIESENLLRVEQRELEGEIGQLFSGPPGQNLIELTVPETSGIDRVDEPVTSGVPLPEGAITSTANLKLWDNTQTTEIPAQFKVLSRWGDLDNLSASIKWVLVDFQANINAGQTGIYYLEYGAGVSHGNYGNDLLVESGDAVHFDTGKLVFDVNKNKFQLFNNLWVGGQQIVVNSTSNGIVVIDDKTGKTFTSTNSLPFDIDIEENGPMKAVLQFQGLLTASDNDNLGEPANWPTPNPDRLEQPDPYTGVYEKYSDKYVHYNARITVYKDKDYAKVLFIIENNGAAGMGYAEGKYINFTHNDQNLEIEDLRLKTQLIDFEANPTLYTINSNYSLGTSDMSLETRGRWDNSEDTFPYSMKIGGVESEAGTKYPGWIEVSNANNDKSVAVGMKYFWQKHPADFAFSNNELSVAVMPAGEGYPIGNSSYKLDGGQHYGSELLYRFSNSHNSQETRKAMQYLSDPLFAFATPEYYYQTKAWTNFAPSNIQVNDSVIQEAIDAYEKQVCAQANINCGEQWFGRNPTTVSSYRGNSSKWFGNLNFGCIRWAKGYSSLHYDWTQGMFLHMMRQQDPLLWKQAQEFLPHERDVDQYWGDRIDSIYGQHVWTNYNSRYEAYCHSSENCNSEPKGSHNWNGGLILGYLLTGDEESLEAAQEHYKYAMNMFGNRLTQQRFQGTELRFQGWTIVGLLNLYRALGKQEYYDLALAIGKNDLLYGEQLAGGKGVWEGVEADPPRNTTYMSNTMYMYVSEALVDLHHVTQDPEIGQLIVRMSDFDMQKNFYGGDYNASGGYRILGADYYYTGTDNRGIVGSPLYGYFHADLAAESYQITGNESYLNFARQLFKDATFYYYIPGWYLSNGYFDPDSWRAPATFADQMYSGTWSKVKGWLLRAHQTYLTTERELGGTILPVCGNNMKEIGEQCDGTDLGVYGNGVDMCSSYNPIYESGDLGCSACSVDTSGCVLITPPTCGDGICNGVETCSSCESDCGVCPPQPCSISLLDWSTHKARAGEVVNMNIVGENGCIGEKMNITIMERDKEILVASWVNPDDEVVKIEDIDFASSVPWTAVWQEDERGNPEYYFIVEINGQTYESNKTLKQDMLTVYPSKKRYINKTIKLKKGKNAFSLPIILDNMSIQSVFVDIIENISKIYTYDAQKRFRIYHFDGKPSNLFVLRPGKGYVLFMKNDSNLILNGTKMNESDFEFRPPTFTLKPGWNLIGTFSNTEKVKHILEGVNYAELYFYNKSSGIYESLDQNASLDEKYSYWININVESSFNPITGGIIRDIRDIGGIGRRVNRR